MSNATVRFVLPRLPPCPTPVRPQQLLLQAPLWSPHPFLRNAAQVAGADGAAAVVADVVAIAVVEAHEAALSSPIKWPHARPTTRQLVLH